MKKIIIIGSPGAGKSTFARALRDKLNLSLFYLDMIWHKPDKSNISRAEFDKKLMKILNKDSFIIDGNYIRTLKMRLDFCDTVFFLDLPAKVCLSGAMQRIGKPREDMPWTEDEFDGEFGNFIKAFPKEVTPIIYNLLDEYKDKVDIKIFKSREEVNNYLQLYDNIDAIARLQALKDERFKTFNTSLIPSVNTNAVIGVKTPFIKKLAKEMIKNKSDDSFLKELPHKYFEENQLHAFIIAEINDFERAIFETERFLPFIDNWATCDQLIPKAFAKNPEYMLIYIYKWLEASHEYTVRYAIGLLMRYFLDERFDEKYLAAVANIKRDEYYIKMMQSWYFATALAKQYKKTLPYFTDYRLEKWVHNKSIQKATESFRVSNEHKAALKNLKYKK